MVKSTTYLHSDLMRRPPGPCGRAAGKSTCRNRLGPPYFQAIVASLFAIGLTAAPAHAQNGERQHSVAGTAGDAATQPLEDFNLKSHKIPAELLIARDAPYKMEGLESCMSLQGEIVALNDVLGPDADAEADETGVMRGALKTGGNLLSGFIPFRGVVRALSGANEKRAEMEAAIYAGIARRSYLKGYSAAKNCSTSKASIIPSAEMPAGQQEDALPFLVIAQGGADDVSE